MPNRWKIRKRAGRWYIIPPCGRSDHAVWVFRIDSNDPHPNINGTFDDVLNVVNMRGGGIWPAGRDSIECEQVAERLFIRGRYA